MLLEVVLLEGDDGEDVCEKLALYFCIILQLMRYGDLDSLQSDETKFSGTVLRGKSCTLQGADNFGSLRH